MFIGWLGWAHDARVLANSDLYNITEEKRGAWLFLKEKSVTVDGVEIPVRIIVDAAYPLQHWLMKGYTQHFELSPEKVTYTHTLSSAWIVVENAFGHLKGHWGYLMKRNDVDEKILLDVVAAWCILHNICGIQKDRFLPEWNVQDIEVGGTTRDAAG